MNEFLNLTIKIITLDFFIGYGLFTFIWLVISIINVKPGLINTLDIKTGKFIQFVGVIYLLCVVAMIINAIITVDSYQIRWYPLFQVLLWTILTQLVRIEKMRKNRIVRLMSAILFVISFEIFVILVTSIYRDYSTGGLFGDLSAIDIVIGLTTKMVVFCLLAIVYSFITGPFKGLRAEW